MLRRVSKQQLSLCLRLGNDLFESLQAEDFFERPHALEIVGIAFGLQSEIGYRVLVMRNLNVHIWSVTYTS